MNLKSYFADLELWDKEKLKELEPKLVEMPDGSDRPENIVAMGAKNNTLQLTLVK